MLHCSIHMRSSRVDRRGGDMARLGDIVKELGLHAGLAGGEPARPLRELDEFGDNPGALRMRVHIPQGLARGAPLVVVLHGCGQSASGYAEGAGWIALAERYGFAVLCPEQKRGNNVNLCFNWFQPQDVVRGSGEAASIASMVARVVADHAIDKERVFITGLSAGGAMAAALLAAYPELFAAGAIVAGLPYGAAEGVQEALSTMRAVPARTAAAWGERVRRAAPSATRWPKVAVWHGDADATVGPAAADALVLQWTDVHGVTRGETVATTSPRHRRTVWRGPEGDVRVEVHRIAGLGHGTPIAAAAPEGCGAPAPWILESGVSSSLEIARSWGVAGQARRADPRDAARVEAASPPPADRTAPSGVDVGQVISHALKKAGLLR